VTDDYSMFLIALAQNFGIALLGFVAAGVAIVLIRTLATLSFLGSEDPRTRELREISEEEPLPLKTRRPITPTKRYPPEEWTK